MKATLSPVHRHLARRRLLGAAVQGLGVMMWGCGKDQGPRPGREVLDTSNNSPRSASGGAGGSQAPEDEGAAGAAGDSRDLFVDVGPLGDADTLGARIPEGYEVRLIATSGEPIGKSGHVWPDAPDGAVTIPTDDGYLYVCNSELSLTGGVCVLEFDSGGDVMDAYSILTGSNRNCQGGLMPWGTFLSCEEVPLGVVHETFPRERSPAQVRSKLGAFRHEAVAYDLQHHHIYLTEDQPDGGLYRFVPNGLASHGFADLSAGTLEVAVVAEDGSVEWLEVPDPEVRDGVVTRQQVPEMTVFLAAEGIWYQEGHVYFATKGDNRVWDYATDKSILSVLYDPLTAMNPILHGPDQILGASSGELLISEDGGDMQVVVLTRTGQLRPLLQLEGQDHSEITGLAFDPTGTRLYFSSQRGNSRGLTYEMRYVG